MLGIGHWTLGTRTLTKRLITRLRFHTGMTFYTDAIGGLAALVEKDHDTVHRVLCEAFLADMAECYQRGSRNCLVLLDNVDDSGRAFLTALAAAKTSRPSQDDPVLAVVASGQLDPLRPLLRASELRPDSTASHADWLATRTSWLYPVRLTDLARHDVAEVAGEWAGFVHSVTGGHPWGVQHVVAALAGLRGRTERDLRGALDAHVPTYDPVLGDVAIEALLPDNLRVLRPGQLAMAAAALEVGEGRAALTNHGWLLPDRPTMHPWLRRLLLRRVPNWAEVFTTLRAGAHDPVAAAHYDVALGVFTDAVTLLRARLDVVDDDQWIAEFDTITSAPRPHVPSAAAAHEMDAVAAHEHLCSKQLAAFDVPLDEQGVTILALATARWLWSDPLCDPLLTLNPLLGNGFRELARGRQRLCDEADFYERGGRP